MAGTKSLFVPGPTNVPDEIRRAIDVPMEDHRAPDLPAFTLPLFADLKKIFKSIVVKATSDGRKPSYEYFLVGWVTPIRAPEPGLSSGPPDLGARRTC